MKRRYFMSGVLGTLGILLFTVIVTIVQLAQSYDGQCGGYLPWLAGPKPCTFWEFVSGNFAALALIVWISYWPFILPILFFPALCGYLLDRRANRHAGY